MRVSVSFFALLEEALRLVFHSRIILGMSLVFGVLLSLSWRFSEKLGDLLPSDSTNIEAWLTPSSIFSQEIGFLFLGLILIGIGKTTLRGSLFLMLEAILLKRLPHDSNTPVSASKQKTLIQGAKLSLLFETGYWFLLVLLFGLLLAPVFFAHRFNPNAFLPLFQMAIVLGGILAIIFFYLKEFSLLYALLASIKPKLALELGLKLFRENTIISLLFGGFLLALSFLFTFFLNLAMIISALVTVLFLKTSLSILMSIVFLGLAMSITEALRLLFFHALAAAPKLPLVKNNVALEKDPENVPTV